MRPDILLERVLFGGRWLQAPLYIGLLASLVLLLGKFALSAADLALHGLWDSDDHVIIGVLQLVDITLIGNLIMMVILAGYENFVSRFRVAEPDGPSWMAHVGFGDLKLRVMGSIVAIASIHLLEDFMNTGAISDRNLAWRAGLALLFMLGGVLLAVMDRIAEGPSGDH